jgi:hypothetical protein
MHAPTIAVARIGFGRRLGKVGTPKKQWLASPLLQSALQTKDRDNRTITAIIEAMRMAEDNLRYDPERGFALLEDVKDTLLKMSGGAALTKPKEMGVVTAN